MRLEQWEIDSPKATKSMYTAQNALLYRLKHIFIEVRCVPQRSTYSAWCSVVVTARGHVMDVSHRRWAQFTSWLDPHTHTHESNMKWLAGNVIGNCEHCARFGIRSKLQCSDVLSSLLLAVWLQRRSFAINGTFSSGINLWFSVQDWRVLQ